MLNASSAAQQDAATRQPLVQRTSPFGQRLRATLCVAAVLATFGSLAPSADAESVKQAAASSSVHVGSSSVILPEWYEYCAKIRPIGITAGRSGFVNAATDQRGVTCKWWVAPWRAGWPHTTTRYYTWEKVCQDLGYRTTWWDKGYPWCGK